MKVLITGSNGFLGRHLTSFYLEQNVFELNRYSGDYKVSLENEIPKFNEEYDLVIHAAGKAHSIPKTESQKQSFFDVNVTGTVNLLKGLEASGLPKEFVFISSVSVYGLESGCNIDENFALLANDPYGKSKILAEHEVQKWCIENNVVCTILRLPLLIGTDASGNLHSMITAIKKGYYFNINGGIAKKSMLLVNDVGCFISKASSVGGVFNITDGYHPSFYELSQIISIQLGKKGKVKDIPFWIVKWIAFVGDIMGEIIPVNSKKLKKLNSDLIFNDSKARIVFKWTSVKVLEKFKVK